jgi:hypothetical protein
LQTAWSRPSRPDPPRSRPRRLITLTFSGTGFANLPQPLAQVSIGGDVVGTTKITIDDTTFTEDGTEKAVGFNEFAFQTDANSQCYINTGTAVADTVITPTMTMPYFHLGLLQEIRSGRLERRHAASAWRPPADHGPHQRAVSISTFADF